MVLPSSFLDSGFPTKHSTHATLRAHLIRLDFIALILFAITVYTI
jgi:hypothetical protein